MTIEGKKFVDEVVRVADLFTTEVVLEDYEFHNCLLVGPGVVFPFDNTYFGSCAFEGTPQALAWIVP